MKVRHWLIIDVILFLLCLLVFWIYGGSFLFGQTPPTPKISITCVATNRPMDVYSAQTKKYEEVDDWHVDCTIKRGEKVVYGPQPLVLDYPASYATAMAAIDEFRKKKYAEVLKEKSKENP